MAEVAPSPVRMADPDSEDVEAASTPAASSLGVPNGKPDARADGAPGASAAAVSSTTALDEGDSSRSKSPAAMRLAGAGKKLLLGVKVGSDQVGPNRGLRKTEGLTKSFHEKHVHVAKEKNRNRAKEMQQSDMFIVDPRKSKVVPKWDMLMVVALIFTACVTPVEVSFLDEGQYISSLWWINRVVDFVFTIDMILTFNLAYQARTDEGGHWVLSRKTITLNYLKGWFSLDLISIFPFYLIVLPYDDPFGYNRVITPANDCAAPSGTRYGVLVRNIKLVRMVKMARVFKASRVLQRVILDYVMNQWEWTYAVLKMLKLMVYIVFFAHWQACLWGLVSSFMQSYCITNWIGEFESEYASFDPDGAKPSGMEVYVAALYWSVMTLTSIGYGAMTPVNTAERALCSIYMLASGFMWTYAIGSVAAIATTLDPNSVMYQNTMDSLNYFMRERELPRNMRMVLRDYFTAARRVHQVSDDGDLLDKMSPLLQGTVALAANKKWLDHIWFFRDLEQLEGGSDFIAALAKSLIVRSFVSHERLPVGQLYILRVGIVVKMWRFLGSGKVWGEDMILDNKELIDHSQAVALTYVEAFTLRRNDLDDVLAEYPAPATRIARASRRVTMQRALLKYLALAQGKAGPRSVALKSHAKGYVAVHEVYTTEQKVDQMYDLLVGGGEGGSSAKRASISDPDGSKKVDEVNSRRDAFFGSGSGSGNASRADSPTKPPSMPSPGGGGDGGALASKVATLSDQVKQVLATQASMAEALTKLSAQMDRLAAKGE